MSNQNYVPPSYRYLTFAIIVAVIGSVLVSGSFYTVRAGEKALVFTWGKITSVTSEGLHFKVPIMQTISKVDIRTQKAEAPAGRASKNAKNFCKQNAAALATGEHLYFFQGIVPFKHHNAGKRAGFAPQRGNFWESASFLTKALDLSGLFQVLSTKAHSRLLLSVMSLTCPIWYFAFS
ncbi:hypothetical protein R83H12_01874 [Fibrobacteria bacterium R8-3-H12]